jgi:MFS family permease
LHTNKKSFSRKSLPEGELKEADLFDKKYFVTHLFRKSLRKTTILLWIVWFANAFAYYGLVLLTPGNPSSIHIPLNISIFYSLKKAYFEIRESEGDDEELDTYSQSVFLSTFITSLAEFPGLFSSAILVDRQYIPYIYTLLKFVIYFSSLYRIGRKRTLSLLLGICGIFSLVLIVDSSIVLATIAAVFARMCIAGAFATIYLYTPEAYPTYIRSTGLGSSTSMSRQYIFFEII